MKAGRVALSARRFFFVGTILWMSGTVALWADWRELLQHLVRTEVKVVEVHDGDSLTLEFSGRRRKVSLAGILVRPIREGLRAEKWMRESGETLDQVKFRASLSHRALESRLEDREGYTFCFAGEASPASGRMEGYLYKDDVLINALMLEQGYATPDSDEPSLIFKEYFEGLSREAKNAGRGLFSLEK